MQQTSQSNLSNKSASKLSKQGPQQQIDDIKLAQERLRQRHCNGTMTFFDCILNNHNPTFESCTEDESESMGERQ